MFTARYFAPRMFARRYWAKVGAAVSGAFKAWYVTTSRIIGGGDR